MKVNHKEPAVISEEKFTWKEIQDKEGVYAVANDKFSSARFVVLNDIGLPAVVLYYAYSVLCVADPACWRDEVFIKIRSAIVNFSITE